MTTRRFIGQNFAASILRNAEAGAGGGAGAAGAASGTAEAGAKSPENVLFPEEKPEAGAPDGAGDWKEYVADPAKSADENARLKVEHDKTKPADDKAKADDPANKVPEDGKYSLKMPEGVQVDQELLRALAPEFKEFGLTQGQAQKLADKFIGFQQARAAKQSEDWAATSQGWADEAKADKDMGGVKWDATVRDARRAVDGIGTPALREYLNASGGGNHPEVIRFMAKVGSMIKEDNPATGGAGGAGRPADAAHMLFPNDVPKGS